ncbi:hypothetical protein [Paucibacter soli]|uniref:hypothetical protein n=1 Tax=Paucibacter soli TaxID=3133433 RepID=UPI0030B3CCED
MNSSTTWQQRWILVALVYFLLAVTLGVGMAATHDFRLRGLHVHLNLLGWVSAALTAWVYQQFPAAAAGVAARTHFWLYNLALPVMMGSLGALLLGQTQAEPVVAASSVLMWLAILIFVLNVFWHRQARALATPRLQQA